MTAMAVLCALSFRTACEERMMKEKLYTMLNRIWDDIYRARWGIPAVVLYLAATMILFGKSCPFRILTGFPCPGCGLTRGVLCILTLRFSRAYSYHPAAFLWAALIGYLIVKRYVMGKSTKEAFGMAVIAALLTIAVYVYRILAFVLGM